MTVDTPSSVVPDLRFPEFRGAGDWTRDQIGDFASISKGKGVSKKDTRRDGATPCIRYAELYTRYGEVIREVVSLTNVPHEDLVLSQAEDVIVPASGETRSDIARAACVLPESVALGSDLNILRSGLYGPFFSYLLNSPLRHTIARMAQGDTVAHLYPKQLSQVWLAYPSRIEQQKIADCLGSLDDLIAAEDRKLEALRLHKKGLVQQLFPQPGETVPRLRFPEFEDAPDWREERLGNLVAISSGKSPSQYALFAQGDCAFVKVDDLNNCSKYQIEAREYCDDVQDAVPSGSILFPKRGAAIENNKIRITASEILIDTNLMALTPFNTAATEFLYYYLVRVGLAQIADTSSIPQINNKHIIPFRVLVPSESESHRIADCLYVLDVRLAAQLEKLNGLKTHRLGLLQRLFPKPKTP